MKTLFKFIIILFIYIFTFAHSAFAEDLYKINSFNYDTSNSMIILTAPDECEYPIMPNVKLVKMENPTRVYFDIENAILTMSKQDWQFASNGLKEVIVSQFSTNPNIVRVVMYLDDDYDTSTINFFKIKNNIVIKLKDSNSKNEYFQNTYRDDHASASDFYEYLTMTTPESPQNEIASEIEEAFNTQNLAKKELKLNTKYFIDRITPKTGAVLLNGFGAITIERPMILTNPSRIVYDIPNTLVKSELRNTEYPIGTNDTVKIGQFSVNKARIVITTEDVNKYIPIISSDNQSLLIANYDTIQKFNLFTSVSNMISYSKQKIDAQTHSMTLAFSNPIVHGIDRTNDELVIYLYNVQNYNENDFRETLKYTPFENANITLLPRVGLKLSIPLEQNSVVNTFLGADGKAFKVIIKDAKRQAPLLTLPFLRPDKTPRPVGSGLKKVVIDAGHGGTDCGAIRDDIFEKDITIDISRQVRDMLVKKGYMVQMTRDSDEYVSLEDRVAISESFNPTIFISIHVNSSTGTEANGIETHYYHQDSMMLAQTVHSAIASEIDAKNRGLFKSKFYVINHTTAPAILIEIGFLSNEEERAQLMKADRRKKTAKAIVEGVENYFKQLK
ncbi:N-acetylmuramoyl-L-alanine amidase [bacterium]|nr:N-acetylmuramoyl-L-alanine amidase [bacterium]